MESNYKRLGDYIEKLNRPNSDLKYGIDDVCGITNTKEIMQGTRANLNGRTFEKFTVLLPNEFIFNRRTSRNGERISLGYNNIGKVCILTEDYCHFRIKAEKEKELLPEYLYLLFCAPEFDRYARYNSWGSATEFFNWEDMCNVKIIIPSLEEQKKSISSQKAVIKRMDIIDLLIEENQKLISIIYEQWFKRLEFPEKYGFKKLCGELIFDSNLQRERPNNWEVKRLTDIINWIGGSQPPKSKFIYESKEGYVRFIQNRDYGSDLYKTYIPISKTNKLCGKYDIMVDKYGDAGKTRYGIEGAYNVALSKIEILLESGQEYVRSFLNDDDIYTYLNETSMASTRSSLNEKNMSTLFICIPPKEILDKYEEIIKPLIKYNLLLINEKRQLEKLREKLL